jgi:hypothetical protein
MKKSLALQVYKQKDLIISDLQRELVLMNQRHAADQALQRLLEAAITAEPDTGCACSDAVPPAATPSLFSIIARGITNQ